MVALPSHEKILAEKEGAATQKAAPAATKWVLQSVLSDQARQRLELADDQQAERGFAAMVLSLVFVSNMSVSVDQLVLYVRKLGPPPECILAAGDRVSEHSSDAHMESVAREAINYLTRQGYLDKVKLSARGGESAVNETQATQQPLDGGGNDGDRHDEGMVYTWGPKAKVEFQPLDMVRFIAAATGQECSDEFVKTIGRAYGSNIAS
ncbi:hypothetical protein GGF44_003002 [Coemansia sp. RSA 1694]|nr:hypothetical protein GGF38_003873 [Coemansia sp. RSA 25]KAJ2637113.1 hypothetical protein GGF44_003002 [Coemansia sp. RSA 1694]